MFQFGMYHSIVLSNWNQKEEEEEEGCMVTASCQFNGFVIATHKEEVWRGERCCNVINTSGMLSQSIHEKEGHSILTSIVLSRKG